MVSRPLCESVPSFWARGSHVLHGIREIPFSSAGGQTNNRGRTFSKRKSDKMTTDGAYLFKLTNFKTILVGIGI